MISDDESDDFTDEDEEQAVQNSTPTPIDHQSDENTKGHSQWYIDTSKTDYCQPLNGNLSSNLIFDCNRSL